VKNRRRTYLFKRVVDYNLPVCVRYPREEVSDGGVRLLVDLFLVLRYRFRDVEAGLLSHVFHLAERCTRLLDYHLPNVVADAVQRHA